MNRLDDITLSDLQNQLEQTNGKVPIQRVLAAIGRKQGDTLGKLAEQHNVCEKTIRNWLDRFAEQPISQAPFDDDRSGRPAKLTESEYDEFISDLRESPAAVGYGCNSWSPALVSDHLKRSFEVEYSTRHVRRIMNEAEISWRYGRGAHDVVKSEKGTDTRRTNQETDCRSSLKN